MNAFGEKQHIEKYIPKIIEKYIAKIIKNIRDDKTLLIHSYPDKLTTGTRFHIHARNIASGILLNTFQELCPLFFTPVIIISLSKNNISKLLTENNILTFFNTVSTLEWTVLGRWTVGRI